MSKTPIVYFLYGEDEVGINAFVSNIRQRMGDVTTADMNTSRFEKRIELGELRKVATAVPFLVARRLVILVDVLSGMKSKSARTEFTDFLFNLPESTACIVIENAEVKDRNWFMAWAKNTPEHTYIKSYGLLKGGALVRWIQEYARKERGEILPQAAQHLVSLIGNDNRHAASEVDKLLAYVNYSRPVEIDDVELLTAPVQQANIFAMVDALGARNGRLALTLLHELLGERDAMSLFGMITRQFRLLLQYKELQKENHPIAVIAKQLGVRDFIVSKLTAQARNFDQQALEMIHHSLTAIDDDMKSGLVELDIALDMLVASVTTR